MEEDQILPLFTSPVISCPEHLDPSLKLRSLELQDYDKGYCTVLEQLTTVGPVTRTEFVKQFKVIQEEGASFIIVIEDCEKSRIIATGTLVVEQKFIHRCGCVGHIEDIVVDKSSRARGLGLIIIDELVKIGDILGCYKIVLDCSDRNIPFYERCGFQSKETQMTKYLPHNEIPSSSL